MDQDIAGAQAQYQAEAARLLWSFGGVMVLVLIVVMPLTLLNSVSITRPVHHARDIALAIAEGDLTRAIHAQGKDETAELLRALDHMQRSLRTLVGEVRFASSLNGATLTVLDPVWTTATVTNGHGYYVFDTLYGEDARKPGTFAANCLLARRLAEKGVRFGQINLVPIRSDASHHSHGDDGHHHHHDTPAL